VLFLDDDYVCESNLVRAHYEAHQQADDAIVSGLNLPAAETRDLAADLQSRVLRLLSSVVKSGTAVWPQVACGTNDSVPREMILQAGGYDERFVGSREEMELGIRLWKMGARVRYQPEAVGYHSYEKSAADLVGRASANFARYELLLCRVHPDYRPFSPLADLFHARLSRRLPMQVVARLPVSPEMLLRFPCALLEGMRWIPGARWVGVRLLRARIIIAELRNAVREAGSWRMLREQFEG
jgi:GT2 family glycosyltransferase